MFDKLANALGVGFDKLKNALGLQEQPSMIFPTTSQDLSRSTQIASQEQSQGYYKGIDTSPFKSQLLGEVKNSLGLNYEDAQIAAYQRGMQAGGPQLASIMGNKPALSDVDFTGGLKNASGAISRSFGSQVGKSIIQGVEPHKLSQIEAKGEILKSTRKLDSLNPTGSVFAKYTPEQRATAELADNITTLDKTMGKSADEMITIYRGSSKGGEIVPGDFITTNKQLAKDYAGTGNVLEKKVKLSDVLDDITEPLGEEYIYRPKTNLKSSKDTTNPLNFKTAEDYVKARPVVYHGTPEKFDNFSLEQVGKSTDSGMFGKGFYFTDDLKEATTYSKRGNKVGEVKEVILDLKKPYIIKTKYDIPKIDVPMDTIEQMKVADKEYSRLFTEKLQKQGYDGVIDMMNPRSKQYVVFNPSQIKTKSQLISEWNKAQKLKSGSQSTPKTPLVSKTEQSLIKEARKYKSADEFVKKEMFNPSSKYEWHLSDNPNLIEGKLMSEQIKPKNIGGRGFAGREENIGDVFSTKSPQWWYQQLNYETGGKAPKYAYLVEIKNPQKADIMDGLAQQSISNPNDIRIIKKAGGKNEIENPSLLDNVKIKYLQDIWNKAQKLKSTPLKSLDDSLIQEAKKYKSADEFIKAQGTPVYHGTASDFEMFDPKFKGYSTDAESAKGAFWFTDDPDTAKAYAIYAAEDAPVQRLLKQADEAEKLAQKTGKESDWAKYDKLVEESEKLAEYDATFARRQKNAKVKEAYVKGEFLEVDAKGKTPQELSTDDNIDSWLNSKIQQAIKENKAGLKILNIDDAVGLYDKPSTHYAVFNADQIKTKSQLTEIWNKAHNNLPGFSTPKTIASGLGLIGGSLALANALGIKPKDNLQSSLDMPDKYEENSAILEKPKYLESEPINEMTGRVKHWSSWSKQYPESYKNLKNAAERVEQEIGIPAELLIDISGIETSGGHSLTQNSDGPGRGYFQFEMPLPSDVKKIADRLFNKQFDPFNAYQSARLAGELIKNRNLSRWGKFGGSWGSIDNQTRDKSERLTTYYSKEELNKYFK